MMKDIFLKLIQYPEKLHKLHDDLPFLLERMNNEKVEKLVTNLALNHGLVLKKFIE